jgi:hypothetical protein
MNYSEMIRQKIAQMDALFDKAKLESRGLNEVEQKLYDDLEVEIKALEASKAKEDEMQKRKDTLRASVTQPSASVTVTPNKKKWN